MARQKGLLKVKGTVGDLTFYKSVDGYLLKEKSEISADRIKNDPAFQRTRENGAEFSRAGKATKVVRTAFRTVIKNAADRRLAGRLTREMMRVIKSDSTSARGLRNVVDGDVSLLEGFDFNINSQLDSALSAPYTATIDRSSGELKVEIASLIPIDQVNVPAGTTHFKIVSGGAEIDFGGENYTVDSDSTATMPWDEAATEPIVLSTQAPANSTLPLFLALGILFYQEVNGNMYLLKNGSYNALALVKVDAV